jgi:FixJ family two-component response regulator
MLVDDDVSFLENMKDGLEYSIKHLKLITHTNAEDAWKSLKENDISLLITDQKLPGMSGVELVNLVDKKYPGIPIFLITAYGTPKLKYDAMNTGALKFFDKPIDLKEMIKAIKKGLKLSKKELTSIRKMSLATVLELISMEKITASLVVKDREMNKRGRIWFREGALIDAEIESLEGIEAVFEMLSFGEVDIVLRKRKHNRVTISDVPLEYVLLEGMKRLDEKEARGREKPGKERIFKKDEKETPDKRNKVKTEKDKFDEAIDRLKKGVEKALLASSIFTIEDGTILTSYNSSSKIGKIFNEKNHVINKYLEKMKLPPVDKYYIMDLSDNKTLIVVTFKKYRWAILLDSRELKLELLLNLILPDIIGMF